MAYTHGYEYDIFISYAHNDNVALAGEDRWVSQFHDDLKNWLEKRRSKRGLKIWFDQRDLQGNTLFNPEIQHGVEQSALFFVIHSRNYQASDYCKKELNWFKHYNQQHRTGITVGNESRLFNVLIDSIPHSEWSDDLSGTSGFGMHDNAGFPSHLQGKDYPAQMRQLIEAAEKTLDALPRPASTPAAPRKTAHANTANTANTANSDHDKPTVFIADVADSLQIFRKRLTAEIQDQAIILPSLPPPYEVSEHNQKLTETLEQASLSIHLLDQLSGRPVDGLDNMTFPRLQAGMAHHRQQSSLLWIPDSLDKLSIEDSDHAKWLDELENGVRPNSGFHFVRSTQQSFIDQVKQMLDELGQQQQGNEILSRFLIDTHQKDQRHAFELAAVLAERGIDVDFNKDTSSPQQGLENFDRIVREVQHLIIMFGCVTPEWVRNRLEAAVKISAEQIINGNALLDAIWVFMLPNAGDKQVTQGFPSLIRINCLENHSESGIDHNAVDALLNYHKEGKA